MQNFKKYVIVLLIFLWVGCASKAPPQVNLKSYQQIGLIDFTIENASGNIDKVVTPTFLTIIGPEGGFSLDEIEAAKFSGVVPVTLGPSILRAETAAIVGLALVLYEFGELG